MVEGAAGPVSAILLLEPRAHSLCAAYTYRGTRRKAQPSAPPFPIHRAKVMTLPRSWTNERNNSRNSTQPSPRPSPFEQLLSLWTPAAS